MPTPSTVSTIPPEIPRDRWGRPLVVPPEGGKPVPYTRCTTFVGAIEDRYGLSKWQMRQVALGLVERQDLRLAVSSHRDDKRRLDTICEEALEAAKSSAAATIGTALHSLTEQLDRGQEVTGVPEEYLADLAAYTTATQDLKPVQIEQFCVQDPLKVGGTPDRVVQYQGKRYIADLKTGSIEYGYLKIAAQLAVYARSRPYDVETGERLDPHRADLDHGIVIHLPAGTGECRLYWVDLQAGWEAVKIARDVRVARSSNFRDLMAPLAAAEAPTPPPVPEGVHTQGALELGLSLEDQIKATRSREEALALWRDNASTWTPAHTDLMKAHLASLVAR